MATQSPIRSVNGEQRKSSLEAAASSQPLEGEEQLKAGSELGQSLSDISSVGSSVSKMKKKKGKRNKSQSVDTPNFSKFEPDDVSRPFSRNSETVGVQHKAKPVQHSLKGMQVCARSSRDGLFYPGVVLKHTDSRRVLVQFADGQTDKVSARFAVPRGGALPCPVLHPGDYVLVRVRSKYGQHPNLSTGQCDYFIPAIVQVTPYKGGMTFPPSSVPVYSAVSFNGRLVTSLRAGMIRISRSFFLAVCRYIQQLMVEISTAVEYGEETERHPALYGTMDEVVEEVKLPMSPSVETLSKLVEKQNEQHQELMERLSQVISLSSPGSVTEVPPASPAGASPSPPPTSQREPQSPTPEPPSREPQRPCSAPSYTQTDTKPLLVEQGTQKTGVQDNWTESLPPTFSQGTSTQLDELLMSPPSDPRLESIESCQRRLLEELEGVSREVSGLRGDREEPANAYLVMQPDGQALLVPRDENTELAEETGGTTPALKIQDLTPQTVSSPTGFSRGERVLVDSRQDGWFYTAEVLEPHGEEGYVVCVKVNGDNVLASTVRILPILSSERRLPEVYSDQRVLAEHPSYPSCYAPGVVMHLLEESGRAMVRLYDDVMCEVPWSKLQPVETDVCSALSEMATQFDCSWMTERVVSRREHTGVFYTGQVVGKSWKTRNFMVQYSDGAIEEQSLAHIFRASGRGGALEEGGYVLASPDTGLFMPGEVIGRREERVVVRFCHGEEKEVELGEIIAISRSCYQEMFLYVSQVQEAGEREI